MCICPADLQPFSENHIQSETNGLLVVENHLILLFQAHSEWFDPEVV